MGGEGKVCMARGTGRVAGEQGPEDAGREGNRMRTGRVAQEMVRILAFILRTMESH